MSWYHFSAYDYTYQAEFHLQVIHIDKLHLVHCWRRHYVTVLYRQPVLIYWICTNKDSCLVPCDFSHVLDISWGGGRWNMSDICHDTCNTDTFTRMHESACPGSDMSCTVAQEASVWYCPDQSHSNNWDKSLMNKRFALLKLEWNMVIGVKEGGAVDLTDWTTVSDYNSLSKVNTLAGCFPKTVRLKKRPSEKKIFCP